MTGIKNILVATDLSHEADQALGQAIFLARLVEADVHLLHVMSGESESDIRARDVERVHERMERAAARRLEANNIMLHTRVIRDIKVVPAVLTYALQIDADLIVMGTRGRRAKDRAGWQSHAEEIARAATCAVLTVGRDAWSMPGMIRRVLVPVSLVHESEPGIALARRLARHQKAEVDILHVVKPSLLGPDAPSQGEVARRRYEQEMLDRLSRVYRSERGPDVRHQVHLRYGDPVSAVTEFASARRSSLIITTSRGATGVRYALEGSSAAAIVGTAPCPVLTLKTNHATALSAHDAVAAAASFDR